MPSFETINIGTFPNDHTGDSLRVICTKVNAVIDYLNGSSIETPPTVISETGALTTGINLVDSSHAPFSVTLPASPSPGDQVQVVDLTQSLATNPISVNSSAFIGGTASPYSMKAATTFLYVSSTYGWAVT